MIVWFQLKCHSQPWSEVLFYTMSIWVSTWPNQYTYIYIYIIKLIPIGEVFECFFLLHVQLLRPIYESRSWTCGLTLEISVIHYYKVKRRLNRKNFKKLSRAALKLLFEDLDLFIIEMISFDISVSFSLGHIGLKLASHLSTSHRFCQL